MGKTEERLRDAATALGSALSPGDIPPLRLPEAGPRRAPWLSPLRSPGSRRWLVPLVTAIAVAVILGLVTLVRSLPSPARQRPVSSARLVGWPAAHGQAGWTAWTVTGHGRGDLVISAVAASGPASAWAFGSDNSGSGGRPVAWRLTGSAWQQVPFPGWRGERVYAAAAVSPTDAWVFTSDRRALHWDGRRWAAILGLPARNVTAAVAFSRSDVWLFSALWPEEGIDHSTWHYNGDTWTKVPAAVDLRAVSATSADDIWAAGGTAIGHWNGLAWTKYPVSALLPRHTRYCGPVVTAVYAVSAVQAWAAGWQGCRGTGGGAVLLRYAGGSWHRVARLGDVDPIAVLPDGRGGVWIQLDPYPQQPGHAAQLRYSGGALHRTRVPLLEQADLWDETVLLRGGAFFAVGTHEVAGQQVGYVLRFRP